MLNLYYKKNANNCIDYVSFEQTFDNQNYVLSYMHFNTPYKGLILAFQLGNGKTYCAAALSYLYLSNGFNVLFIAHNSGTILNFIREYDNFINDNQLTCKKKIKCMGLTKFSKCNLDIEGYLVIIDEAHNLRQSANRFDLIKNKLNKKYVKLLIITATPMIDSVTEINDLRKLVEIDAPIIYGNASNFIPKKYVSNNDQYPNLFISKLKGKQLNEYASIYDSNDLYSKARQVSLSTKIYDNNIPLDEQSAKFNALINSLIDKELTVVFIYYIEYGIKFLESVLNYLGWVKWPKIGIKVYASISGSSSKVDQESIISSFNNINNKNGELIAMLIGSSVINESINLRNVRHIHIISGFWNHGQIDQSIGRCIRMNSHVNSNYTEVLIYYHVSLNTVDMLMHDIATKKKHEIEEMTVELNKLSINNTETIVRNIIPKADNNLIIDCEDYIWDFTNCFSTNYSKISWCIIDYDKIIGYNKISKLAILSKNPDNIIIHNPKNYTWSIWRSCIDQRVRISNISSNKKYMMRGKLINNISNTELNKIAKSLNIKDNTKLGVINYFKESNLYFDKQIYIK